MQYLDPPLFSIPPTSSATSSGFGSVGSSQSYLEGGGEGANVGNPAPGGPVPQSCLGTEAEAAGIGGTPSVSACGSPVPPSHSHRRTTSSTYSIEEVDTPQLSVRVSSKPDVSLRTPHALPLPRRRSESLNSRTGWSRNVLRYIHRGV